ncbi:MAG: metallophosphoesterase [Spirochaetales bacterium]|nr:metallophosphoesterase [Spirochaetales bacterium]
MRTFVIGDIHGAYRALLQCLERAEFDYADDHLIVLGDVCDGYPEVNLVIDELLKIEHCAMIIGNHDLWALDWALYGRTPRIWTSQGGNRTIASYSGGSMPRSHLDFLKNAQPWIMLDNRLFVHGGFNPNTPLSKHSIESLVWDRDLMQTAWMYMQAGSNHNFGDYTDIFIGHTPTEAFGETAPIHACNVWNLDTGAGWSGRLTIMDAETKQWLQSDPSPLLYKGIPGR